MMRLMRICAPQGHGFVLAGFVWCFLGPITLSFGQTQKPVQAVEVIYDFYLDLGLARRYQSSLILLGSRGLFVWGKPLEIREEQKPNEFHLTIGGADSLGSYTYTDLREDRMYSRIPFQDARSYQVCESMPDIPWTLGDETRQIGPYRCERATGSFRGRRYEVWFAPEVSVGIGPWKLHGLPGLVVLARDDSGEIVFRLNTLKRYPGEFPEVHLEEDCLDVKGYERLQKEWADILMKRMNAKLPRGSRLSLGSQNTMERFE